ncbi:unnamed protein product [Peronospora destructor]|uniref:Uncharacterized protein n=1 Tax=Peronospora destructor TaxID=86335 RepID=A0AAV0UK40_9STRA|nr:unnamed protein product [Peronospora destructor]CAI5737249.1 unnamed protein product [Peronospora destructor]
MSNVRMTNVVARRAGSTSHVWGYVVVLMAGLVFVSSMYVMVFSKLLLWLPETLVVAEEVNHMATFSSEQETERSNLLLALERDVYYCFLVPLTIPVTILACYANWVSLKFFRHN